VSYRTISKKLADDFARHAGAWLIEVDQDCSFRRAEGEFAHRRDRQPTAIGVADHLATRASPGSGDM
jgi:hypothetical protein